ncbi:MAG: rod shape-determining protein MreD [Actinobacteria bacterium]|nr:rod shape-determining protein MreD [Actinomycetota bacterium]
MSRRRWIFLACTVLLAFILQIAVMPQFKLFGVQPDLILVVAVVVAVLEGPVEGAIVGFCGGMLEDIFWLKVHRRMLQHARPHLQECILANF